MTLKDRKTSEELRQRLGIVGVSKRVWHGRLGHADRKDADG